MLYYEEKINVFLNSRTFTVLLAILLLCSTHVAHLTGTFMNVDSGNGIFYSLSTRLIDNSLVSMGLNVVGILAITALTVLLNKNFGFIRAVTFSYASMFLLLQLANPFVCTQFYAGTAMCLVMVISMFVLFSTYQEKGFCQQRIFLIFALLAFCCMFQYAFLVLLVAFLIGFFLMGAVDVRGVLAMLLGIVTPFWIMIGLGITHPLSARLPLIETIWTSWHLPQVQLVITTTAVVAVLSILLLIVNMFTILNYRLQIRVYNYFFIVLTVVDIFMMCIDYRNMMIYIPILNWCLAIQVAHAFTINGNILRRYIPVVIMIVAGLGAYVGFLLL